jgi:hypothetical protein
MLRRMREWAEFLLRRSGFGGRWETGLASPTCGRFTSLFLPTRLSGMLCYPISPVLRQPNLRRFHERLRAVENKKEAIFQR